MQDFGEQLSRLTQAITAEGREAILAAASAIADHPQLRLTERLPILGSLGTNVPAFRHADKGIHDATIAVKKAAETGSRDALWRRLITGSQISVLPVTSVFGVGA